MPTTDAALAAVALDALVEVGVPFAVLHGEAEVVVGETSSDLDVVVGCAPERAVVAIGPALKEQGLRLIVAWPYDVCTLTTFWCDAACWRGLQLDMLCDPGGRNRYGVRSPELLARTVPGTRWPRLDPVDELVYLLRKRQVKGDGARFADLLNRARTVGVDRVLTRADEVLAPPAARVLRAAVVSARVEAEPMSVRRNARRYVSRLRRPVGFWAHLRGAAASAAGEVARRFDAVLVGASTVELSRPAAASPMAVARILTARLRPALVVSTGVTPKWPRPDLVVDEIGSVDEVCGRLVAAMERRLEEVVA